MLLYSSFFKHVTLGPQYLVWLRNRPFRASKNSPVRITKLPKQQRHLNGNGVSIKPIAMESQAQEKQIRRKPYSWINPSPSSNIPPKPIDVPNASTNNDAGNPQHGSRLQRSDSFKSSSYDQSNIDMDFSIHVDTVSSVQTIETQNSVTTHSSSVHSSSVHSSSIHSSSIHQDGSEDHKPAINPNVTDDHQSLPSGAAPVNNESSSIAPINPRPQPNSLRQLKNKNRHMRVRSATVAGLFNSRHNLISSYLFM